MILIYVILVILACVALGFFVLIQNPKGGGLSETFGGVNNNFFGVKQTTDILEKGTWILVSVIAFLSITSTIFIKEKPKNSDQIIQNINTSNLPNKK